MARHTITMNFDDKAYLGVQRAKLLASRLVPESRMLSAADGVAWLLTTVPWDDLEKAVSEIEERRLAEATAREIEEFDKVVSNAR